MTIGPANMKFLVVLFVQLLIVHVVWSATGIHRDSRHPDYPGRCYLSGDPPTLLSPGETTRSVKGKCMRASCRSDFSLRTATCGTVLGPEEYYVPANYSLPYPKCCPTYVF